ncbi:DNA-directed RNA polymerase II subunit RPB1-like isoform X1 [Amphibalanus amphitrite]|uniref:DNA-directed RNA polymerase II subunit RPB1-like isoform X1 n=1 Tax=Amphibalanus amphitrite TaxID=1232801 RepID=UPI001C9215FA|nr:DNA-directed RNA polymerase II subunit RPB1-like isoform X1 [Amphibalanus amphitrite]
MPAVHSSGCVPVSLTAACSASFAALAALATAQSGYSYGAPPTTAKPGYDYQEPSDPFGAGNNPGGAVVKPSAEEDHHHGSSDPLQWLRDAVPGEPGVDYPIYATIPPTGFTCDGRIAGYYADVEAGCQPFHVCSPVPGGEAMKLSFLCPNGTIFNQEGFACQWWNEVDCDSAEQFYSKNEEIGVVPDSAASNNVGSVVNGPASEQNQYQPPQTTPRPQYQPPQTTPRPQYQAPQTSRPRPQPQPSRPRPQPVRPQPQPSRPRPQPVRPQPQPSRPRPQPVRPQPQPSRPRPQPVRPVPNQYIPPTTTTTTLRPPPGLYNLPRN